MNFEQSKISYWLLVVLLITNIGLLGTLVYQNTSASENEKYSGRYYYEKHPEVSSYTVIDNKLGVLTVYHNNGEILSVVNLNESAKSILD